MMMLIFANFLLVLGREREVWDSKGQVNNHDNQVISRKKSKIEP